MAKINFLFTVAILAITFNFVQPLNEDEKGNILKLVEDFIPQCAEQFPFTPESIAHVMESGNFSALDPCFLACVMKKVELLDNSGRLDKEKTYKLAEEYLSPEDQKHVPDTLNACLPENEKPVSDGDKGCERTVLLLQCASDLINMLFKV